MKLTGLLLLTALLAYAAPADPQSTPSPPAASDETKALYVRLCQACHGPDGKSPLKDLSFVDRAWKHGTQTSDMVEVISEGVPGTLMVSFRRQLTEAQILDLARYVRSLDPKLPPEKQ